MGQALGTTKEASQKRISRALEKLRVLLGRRGVSLSLAVLTQALVAGAAQAAPPGLSTRAGEAALTALAKGGAAVWIFRAWPFVRSGLAGAAGAAALCAAPLGLGTGAGRVEAAAPQVPPARVTVPVFAPPPPLVDLSTLSVEDIVTRMAALLEGGVNQMDVLRLQKLLAAIPAPQAAGALASLEKKLSPSARAASESHGTPVRCALLLKWAEVEPLAALDNLVGRFDPQEPREKMTGGNWGDTAASCLYKLASADREGAKRWHLDALRSGKLDYQERGEFMLLDGLLQSFDSIFYSDDPRLVMEAAVEATNRTGSSMCTSVFTSRGWDVANLPGKIEVAQRLKPEGIRNTVLESLEDQRIVLWITTDLKQAREWLAAQQEKVQSKYFTSVIFPSDEARKNEPPGTDWTQHADWAVRTMPGQFKEDRLISILHPWFYQDPERSSAWLISHSTSAKTTQAAFKKLASILDDRKSTERQLANKKLTAQWLEGVAALERATREVAVEWQRRDPDGARAAADNAVGRLTPWPAISRPLLEVLKP